MPKCGRPRDGLIRTFPDTLSSDPNRLSPQPGPITAPNISSVPASSTPAADPSAPVSMLLLQDVVSTHMEAVTDELLDRLQKLEELVTTSSSSGKHPHWVPVSPAQSRTLTSLSSKHRSVLSDVSLRLNRRHSSLASEKEETAQEKKTHKKQKTHKIKLV